MYIHADSFINLAVTVDKIIYDFYITAINNNADTCNIIVLLFHSESDRRQSETPRSSLCVFILKELTKISAAELGRGLACEITCTI